MYVRYSEIPDRASCTISIINFIRVIDLYFFRNYNIDKKNTGYKYLFSLFGGKFL